MTPAVGEAYARDPLVSHAASAGWLRAIGRAQRDVRSRAPRLRVPTLLMASGGDRLVDPEATRQFAREAAPGIVEFVWWDGFYHEMLNDIGREASAGENRRLAGWADRCHVEKTATSRTDVT